MLQGTYVVSLCFGGQISYPHLSNSTRNEVGVCFEEMRIFGTILQFLLATVHNMFMRGLLVCHPDNNMQVLFAFVLS